MKDSHPLSLLLLLAPHSSRFPGLSPPRILCYIHVHAIRATHLCLLHVLTSNRRCLLDGLKMLRVPPRQRLHWYNPLPSALSDHHAIQLAVPLLVPRQRPNVPSHTGIQDRECSSPGSSLNSAPWRPTVINWKGSIKDTSLSYLMPLRTMWWPTKKLLPRPRLLSSPISGYPSQTMWLWLSTDVKSFS